MNGLSYLYNALNNRQARIERDELEAQRILEQERQRKQRAAANKHAGMMNTLNLLGTVGGAIAGASGGPGAAMAGASLGSALASGITGIAPNVMGTQPSADNPYYDAPSDSQRALSAINAGLQVASAYETNLKNKYLANETQRVALKSREYIRNGDYDSALNLTTPGEEGGLAPIWGELGVKEGELPWYVSANELNSIAAAESVRLSDQIFPAIESRKLDSQFQSVDLVRTAGSAAGALELIGPVLSAKGNKSKINEYLGTLSPEQRASIEGIASQPFFIQKEVASHIYTLQGKNAEALAKAQRELAQEATKSFNAKVDKNINTVGKMYNQVVYGGTDFDLRQSAAIKDRLTELGIFTNQELTPEEFLIVHQMTVGFSPEQMASAAAKNFDNQDRVQQAFENLAQATGDSRFAEVGAMYQQKLQAGTVGVPSQYASVLGVGSGNATAKPKDSESSAKRVDAPANPSLQLTYNQEADFSDTNPSTKYASQNDTATLAVPDTLENQAAGAEISAKAAEELTDQNVLAQAQGKPTGLAQQLGGLYPTADMGAAQPSTIRQNNIAVPTDAAQGVPLDTRMAAQELGVDPVEFSKSVATADQQDAIARSTPVPGGGTQNPAADANANPVPLKRVGQINTGRPMFQDQLGRFYAEMPEVLEVMGYGFVVTPTVDAQTGQVRDIEQVSSLVMDSIETKGAPFDPDTNQQLPTFATKEEAETYRDVRKEDIGESVPSVTRFFNTVGRQESQGRTLGEMVYDQPQNQEVQDSTPSIDVDAQRQEAAQEAADREQGEKIERGFDVYLRNRRAQQQLANEEATPIGPVQPKEADRAAGVPERYRKPGLGLQTLNEYYAKQDLRRALDATPGPKPPSYLENTTFDELSQDEYDKLPPNQKATYSRNRVALPRDVVEERKEPPAASKPQAMLEKALKTEGLEGMTPVIRDMIQLESSGNPEASNQMGSSAFGLLQLTDDTFERYAPKGAKRGDQKAEIAAAVALLKDNKTYLEKNEVTPNFVNLYIVHHFGKGGLNLLKADPDELITEVTYRNSNTGERERLITAEKIAQNPWLNSSMTVSEMLEKVRDARERGQFGSTGGAA